MEAASSSGAASHGGGAAAAAATNDWEANRQLITSLYRDQNKTLKETMQIMADSHSFFASAKMYKTHIKKWGIDKNMKARDAIEIVRQQKARAALGKSSVVYVRGRRVEPSKMQQYLHRVSEAVANEILLNTAEEAEAAAGGPPYGAAAAAEDARVVVRTPSPTLSAPGSPAPSAAAAAAALPRRLDDPADLRLPQECLQILGGYLTGGYETGRWKLHPALAGPDTINSCAWLGHLNTAREMITHHRTKQGFHLLGICLDQYKLHLLQPDADFWPITYAAIMGLWSSDPKLADMFIAYASRLASIVLPPDHPFNLIWSRLARMRIEGIRAHAPAIVRAIVDTNSRYFTLMSPHRSYETAAIYYALHWLGMLSADDIGRLNREGVAAARASADYGVQRHRCRLATQYMAEGRAAEAELELDEVAQWLATQPAGDWTDLRMELHYETFRVRTMAGKPAEVQRAAWVLYQFCLDAFGPGHYTTTFTGNNLETYFRAAGQTQVADRLRRDFEAQWKLLCKKARTFRKDKSAVAEGGGGGGNGNGGAGARSSASSSSSSSSPPLRSTEAD